MRDLLLDVLEEVELDRTLDWVGRHRGAVLLGTAVLAAVALLAAGPEQALESSPPELAPDETPLFV